MKVETGETLVKHRNFGETSKLLQNLQ